MSVLEELVAAARLRARDIPSIEPSRDRRRPSFAAALAGRDHLKVIAEYKQSSPSAGVISREHKLAAQLSAYERAGAAAVSVLTEPTRFGGAFEHLEQACGVLTLPILMKDFIVDLAQIRYAAVLGASAVLLIVRCLDSKALEEFAAACASYELDALVECHTESEIERALLLPHAVIGINNRDLDTLVIDRSLASRLVSRVPPSRIAVAESGYETAEQTRELHTRANAVLIGSALMRAVDPTAMIANIAKRSVE